MGGTTSSTATDDAGRDARGKDAGIGEPRIPALHRPTPVECSHSRGRGTADPNMVGGPCVVDADCTEGDNGRCMVSVVGAHVNACSYDKCFTDAACGGKACICRESASLPNSCAEGNCTVDADCGVGRFCSPSVSFQATNFGVTGYWCHEASDACVDDADCQKQGSDAGVCAYDPKTTHWACSHEAFLPP